VQDKLLGAELDAEANANLAFVAPEARLATFRTLFPAKWVPTPSISCRSISTGVDGSQGKTALTFILPD